VTIREIVKANKQKIPADEAVALAMGSSMVLVAKGKKVLDFRIKAGQLQGGAKEEDLRKAIVGPSGNLRAPTIRTGKTLIVGFHPDLYAERLP